MIKDFKADDICYVLCGYDLERCQVVSVGRARLKVKLCSNPQYFFTPRMEKVASSAESIVIVWETWKGKNGRGAYRIEREKYPLHRIPANMVARQPSGLPGSGHVTEDTEQR
jgi:hypothetical protein